MQTPIAEFWYGIESCDDNIVHLREACVDPYLAGDMWLVRGSARDVLIDTGTGIVSPEPVVRSITGRPVLAIACNCFYDHAGGWHFFENRACHRIEVNQMVSPTVESSDADFDECHDMFLAHPHAKFEIDAYRMQGATATVLFNDGDIIDLGDRSLEVLHMPGMSAGSIAVWEAKTGSLFSSDTLYDDPLTDRHLSPSEPTAFAKSLCHLRTLPVKTTYGGHFGRFGRSRMLELIDRYFEQQAR